MKPYVFGLGVLLMLAFSFTGLTFAVARTLRRVSARFSPFTSIAVGFASLVALIAALAWSVPPRG